MGSNRAIATLSLETGVILPCENFHPAQSRRSPPIKFKRGKSKRSDGVTDQ
ncbi:hypothetical protein H6G41_33210 [Tolypothrix sp. FACHB-123]|uniref:hypothetical protein n=1 Tax=Tolypothrix sp. FACHB-123 TaxID=2692868 RepID=UPI001686F2D6|nr:hypothetical protein [Tolypothrix sp. FACHB-123]MBD2359386.1 hypothetical protein [Tolypothrix sp. FACHB-123]